MLNVVSCSSFSSIFYIQMQCLRFTTISLLIHVLLYVDAQLMTTYMSDSNSHQPIIIQADTYPSGYIVSHHGYGSSSPYPEYLTATVTLTGIDTAEDDLIILEFETFDLPSPSEGRCSDYLSIAGSVYCAGYYNQRIANFRLTTNSYTFYFSTDYRSSNNGVGFKFKYTGNINIKK